MNTTQVRNSIYSALCDMNIGKADVFKTLDNIMAVLAAENWDHKAGECLTLSQLSEAEFFAILKWSQNAHKDYTSKLRFVQDMREVFPGLSLVACVRYWTMVTA